MNAVPARIQVVTCNGSVVEISSASREAIVAQLQRHRQEVGFELRIEALDAFERAGASGPVKLGRDDLASLIDAINALAERVGGASQLESGVGELQRKIVKELRPAQAEEDAATPGAADPRESHPEWWPEEARRTNAAAAIVLLAGLLWVARSISSRVRRA